jgi:hypothetical protein
MHEIGRLVHAHLGFRAVWHVVRRAPIGVDAGLLELEKEARVCRVLDLLPLIFFL